MLYSLLSIRSFNLLLIPFLACFACLSLPTCCPSNLHIFQTLALWLLYSLNIPLSLWPSDLVLTFWLCLFRAANFFLLSNLLLYLADTVLYSSKSLLYLSHLSYGIRTFSSGSCISFKSIKQRYRALSTLLTAARIIPYLLRRWYNTGWPS